MSFPAITSVVLTRYYSDLAGQSVTAYVTVAFASGDTIERAIGLDATTLPSLSAADIAAACETVTSISPITVFTPPPPPPPPAPTP